MIPNDLAIRKTIATEDNKPMHVMNKPQLLLILSLLATSGPRLHAATEQVQLRAGLVAVVNDRLILGSDIRERMYSTTETLRRQYRNDPALFEQKLQAQQRIVLEDLINDELILAEAIAAGGLRYRPDHSVDGTLSFGCFTWTGCAAMLLAAALAQTKMR